PRLMRLRIHVGLLALALVAGGGAFAQTTIRTEKIKPLPAPSPGQQSPKATAPDKDKGRFLPSSTPAEIITDLARLPAPVARTRERLLSAARSGDLRNVAALMQDTVFSFTDEKDPIAFWKANYPDSEGVEVLSILVTILESGFVRVNDGTGQEAYVWPYFVRLSLKALTPQQKVELFRIITGADYKDMIAFGAYSFYRVGI